ncbi:MAG: dihydrofolate reductase [Bacteroidetes bacterium]|nr:dihydrofolate reductase [Bacteroidota bacterium]
MRLNMVVAASENNVIGKDNQLLWRLPNDMKFFKNVTWGLPVIMGRKTFQSLGKALPGRTNIVITRKSDFHAAAITVVSNIDDAVSAAKTAFAKEIFIIGGAEIYKQTMPMTDRIYITRVHGSFDGDSFFPEIDPTMWRLHSRLDFPADEKHAYGYSFEVWDRTAPKS